jgi:hypothetical protein
MTRDAAILKMIDLFRKDREIDEPKVMRSLQALLDKRIPGDERSWEDKERTRDANISQLEPLTPDELEVVRESIRALERIAPD